MSVLIDTEASDLWAKQAQLRWGKYLTEIETMAIENGLTHAKPARQPPTAMDIGCESGRWTRVLIDKGYRVTSTEICEKKIAACQSNNPEAKCILVSPEDSALPVGDGEFDLATSIEVEVCELDWFVPELKRTLSDNGVAVFTLNNRNSYRGVLANLKSWVKGDEIYYPRSYSDLRRQLVKHDFIIEKAIGFGWFPFNRFSNSKLIPFCAKVESFLQLRRLPNWSPWVAIVCRKKSAGNAV